MIEKRFPRKLNKSADSRVLGVDSMSDALNITVSEDVEGNSGVIKPVKSNRNLEIPESFFSFQEKTVVGKIACDKYNVLYFFVADGDGPDGIFAYDPDGYLPFSQGGENIVKIFQDNSLQFDINGFVKADITYIQRSYEADDKEYIDTPFIFFTDNNSEPKKLNVLRAINSDYDQEGINDFLFACTKAPINPITSGDDEAGGFIDDTDQLQNEFLNVEGFQFAYQNVHKDGFESAISAYSKVFVPPGYLRYMGVSDIALLNAYNAISIVVPNDDMSPEVQSVKILARRGNDGVWQAIKEIDYEGEPISYTFHNDTVNSTLGSDVQRKQFDSLPPVAETQTIIDNRLMYGNYVDGFDNVDIDAQLSAVFSPRPDDFKEYEVRVIPSSCPSPAGYDGEGAQNKNIGFTIDASDLDGTIPQGSFVSMSFTVSPKSNFHVYNATGSYHQSPQMGEDFDNGGWVSGGRGTIPSDEWSNQVGSYTNESDVTGHPKGYWWQNSKTSGANFLAEQQKNFGKIPAVCAEGVNSAVLRAPGDLGLIDTEIDSRFNWRYFDMASGVSNFGTVSDVDFGTSAANPFIVQGRPFTIRASFTAKQDLTRAQVAQALADIMDGVNSAELNNMAEDITFPTSEELSYDIDLGLNNGSTVAETDPIAKLITTVGNNFSQADVDDGETLGIPAPNANTERPVKGFFVVNKAKVEFGIFRDERYLEEITAAPGQYESDQSEEILISEVNDKPRARFGIYVKRVTVTDNEEAVLSCMRRPHPGARWFFFAPWNKDGNENTDAVDNVLEGQADFREYSLFPFTGENGEEQPGLMNNPNFGGKGHNIDRPDAPQDEIYGAPGSSTEGLFGGTLYVSLPSVNGLVQWLERYVFANQSIDGPEDFDDNPRNSPWAEVLGGLYYKPTYVASAGGTVFFEGERSGISQYSLMDGQGGPGGGGVDSNSIYDTYVLHGLNGPTPQDYGVGLGSLGSVPLLGISYVDLPGGGAGQGGTVADDKNLAGLRGPGLDNNIWLQNASPNFEENRQRLRPGVVHDGDDEITFLPFSPSSDGFNIGNRIYNTTTMPTIVSGTSNFGGFNQYYALKYGDVGFPAPFSYFGDIPDGFQSTSENNLYEAKLTNPLGINEVLFVIPPGTGGKQSFKAGAHHAFGIVFYDERGRASNVNPIGTCYVPWFGDRGGYEGNAGPVESILCTIPEGVTAPEGATHFRFVYSGNTSMSRWVQYSAANAFVVPESGAADSGNIYVSLNHLQSHPISFSKSKGARSVEGAQDVYTFREGDRLRIVSYYNSTTDRVFPSADYEFNIVDQVFLSQGTDNPLYNVEEDGELPHPSKVGSFLILENNINATNFTFDLVEAGENDPDTNIHAWHKRCVFEVYSPTKTTEEENLAYYEVGPVFPVEQLSGERSIFGGDTWFKTEAVNFQKIEGGFKSLIQEDSSTSNFFPYNIESQPFSTKVANSDVWGKGKIKIVLPNTSRSRKEASITYSEKNNPISKINTITSFNPIKAQFKDLPSEFGDINYMINNDDSIFVIQSNRCSSIPVNRNLITDGGGNESLVAARQVLGTERYYAGNYGCDNNPESVCDIGNTVYFASKSNRQVYKFNPANGVQVISELGMKSYFKSLFELAEEEKLAGNGEIRVVGGYDPFDDVYILSVFNQTLEETIGATGDGEDPTIVPDDPIGPDGDGPVAPDGDDPVDPTDGGDDPVDPTDPTEDDEGPSSGGGGVEDDFPDVLDPIRPDEPRDPSDPDDPRDPRDPRDPIRPVDPIDTGDGSEDVLDGLTGYRL